MRRLVILIVVISASVTNVFACSTFLLHKNGQLVFGHNLDWLSDAGLVCTNLRGLAKTSAIKEGKKISWVSRYGSITFNQYGKEFPTGGMNEEGLVIEIMWLDDSKYQKPDARPELNVLQWIQYQLDLSRSVDEVIATDAHVRIAENNPPVHFLIADARGIAATIEFLDGKRVVHRGSNLPLPVLTNTDYATSVKKVSELSSSAKNGEGVAFDDNSLQRFSTVCAMVQRYQAENITEPMVDYSFKILGKVAAEEFTKWSIVYDISNKAIYFKTASQPGVKTVSFKQFQFDCGPGSLTLDMNEEAKGDVSKLFKPLKAETNSRILTRAANETRRHIQLSDDDIRTLVNYAGAIVCNKDQQLLPRRR